MTSGPALDRVLRVMSLGVGIAAIIFGGIRTPDLIVQAPVLGLPWTIATAALFVLPAVTLVPLSFRAPLWILQGLALTSAAGFIVTGLLVPLVLPGGILPAGAPVPWALTISALATSVVAIWLPPIPTGIYLVVSVLVVESIRVAVTPGSEARIILLDSCYTVLFNLIFAVLALALRSSAQRVDTSTELAMAETRAVASADSRNRERSRIAALIHDRVLVTLLAAAGPERSRRESLIPLATSALRLFEEPHHGTDSVSARDLTWRTQSLATELSPGAVFTHHLGDPEMVISAEVADALVEAAAEALRNSLRHADPGDGRVVSYAVNVHSNARRFEVTVLDDGRGFDPTAVPHDRLGISVSIRSRMAAVPGGAAFVVSEPGVGTRVLARWEADG